MADDLKPVQTRGGTRTVMQLVQMRGGTRTVMQLVQMRGEILYNIICYAICANAGWNAVQYSFVMQLCADDVKLVQMRSETQYSNDLLCNLCR